MPTTLLIVDDDPSVREMLLAVLELHGFHVLVAEGTTAALALAATHQVDAAVSDYQMPLIDGLEFCRTFRQQFRDVPVWIMTGNAALSPHEVACAGAAGLIRKPFHPRALVDTITRVLPVPAPYSDRC